MTKMDVLNEIRLGLANLDASGRMLPITALPVTAPAWIFREDAVFGVAVELPDGLQVAEGFAGARLVTADRLVDGEPRRLLRLESSIEALRNEFAVVCAQMVTPGPDGVMRAALVSDPLGWWERWRHLMGNAMISQTAYATLGELLALERLLGRGEQVEWRGPLGGSIDIATRSGGYEVKSTVSRYDSRVHVSGQFQLALVGNRPLSLLHYRFEPTASGESVNSVCSRLVAAGYPALTLEDLLARCGLEAGCAARNETFTLLESRFFPVDAAFPRITPASFAGGTLPAGIVHVEYQVDLSGLAHEPF
jgi:hypothetical protein